MADSQQAFDCSICLQILEDPVTTACGHSYCKRCINGFWDCNKGGEKPYSCPHCRETFLPRPALKKNTLLADLLEDHKRSSGQTAVGAAAAATASSSGLQCDVCAGPNQEAVMFCQVCVASYCDSHLQPHFEVGPLKRHRLIAASARSKESICRRHHRLLEIHCRTDGCFLCLMCAVDEHKGHDTVTVEEEQCEMQRKLDRTKQDIGDRVLQSRRKMAELQDAEDTIRVFH